MAWRADCPIRDLVCSPSLVSVHSWFRLPNPDGFFYPMRTPVRLFIHHFRSPQSVTHLCLSAWLVVADLCSTFVEHFLASRVKHLDVTVSTSILWNQMFFLFHQCNTYCMSYMELCTHNWSCVCLPLCLLDAPVFV